MYASFFDDSQLFMLGQCHFYKNDADWLEAGAVLTPMGVCGRMGQ
jgi:hypothetical protein